MPHAQHKTLHFRTSPSSKPMSAENSGHLDKRRSHAFGIHVGSPQCHMSLGRQTGCTID
jgi:hypothetical protein